MLGFRSSDQACALHILAVDPQRRQTLLAKEGWNEASWARVGKATLLSETPGPYGFCGFARRPLVCKKGIRFILPRYLAYFGRARGPGHLIYCGGKRSVGHVGMKVISRYKQLGRQGYIESFRTSACRPPEVSGKPY